jgi:hypothetical protein
MAAGIEIRYSYEPVPTCKRFAASNAFIRAICGPIGSGKSSASVIEIVRRGRAQKPGPDGIRRSRWAVIRNTIPELRETTMKTVFGWLPEAYFGRHHVSEHRYVIKAFEKCEIEILFLALDRPDDIKKLLSLELTGAWVNEAREVPWSIIEVLQGRVGRFPAVKDGGCSWYGIWLDTNPPDADSPFYKFFEERNWAKDFLDLQERGILPADMRQEDYVAIFHQPGGLSPEAENLVNLPGGALYYAKQVAGKSADWVKVYINGEYGFVIDGKPVFPEYRDTTHCRDLNPVPGRTIYRGWDFGLTPACTFSQILPNGSWLTFNEMVATRMGIERFADQVLEHCAVSFPPNVDFHDIGDPAGENASETDERTCFEIMWNKGIRIEGGMQSPAIRQESIRKPLMRFADDGEPGFALHSRCKMLRKGFQGGYRYRRMKISGERYSDQPEKDQYSHPMDALQYVATRLFGTSIISGGGEYDDFPTDGDGIDFMPGQGGRSEVTGY